MGTTMAAESASPDRQACMRARSVGRCPGDLDAPGRRREQSMQEGTSR